MKTLFVPSLILVAVSACSSAPQGVSIHDPYEARNRSIHDFNKNLTGSLGGDDETRSGPRVPPDIAVHVTNFADHVALPGAVLNNVLQGDIGGASTNTMRFIINTLVGVVGIWDPAGAIGLEEVETDFGQTLTVWGAPEGAYLELPFVGPSTERDFAGDVVDALIDPLGLFATDDQLIAASVGSIAGRVVKIDQVGDTISDVLSESADSYAQARLIYLQNRRFELGIEATEVADPYADLYGDQ